MKTSIRMTLVGSLLVAMNSNLFAQDATVTPVESKKQVESAPGTLLPEGLTLPKNMSRIGVRTRTNVGAGKTYDKDGKSSDSKADYNSTGLAVVAEYGVSNQLTLALAAPFAIKNEMDGQIKANDMEGKTGLSDIEAGFLYNFLNNDQFVASAGLGMRLPTGQYSKVPLDMVPTGLGAYDLGLRMNVDYKLSGLVLSLQDQEEIQVASVKRKLSSPEMGAFETRNEKQGLSRKSFAQAAYALGALSQDLRALSVKTRYAYQYDAEVKTTSSFGPMSMTKTTPSASIHKVGFGTGVDATQYGLPLTFDAMYMVPVGGTRTDSALRAPVHSTVEVAINAYI